MKKILIVGVADQVGGIETLFKGLFEQKNTTLDISFLCFGTKCAFEELYLANGYHVYYIPTRREAPLKFNSIVKAFFKQHNDYDYIWVNTLSTSMYQIQYYGKRYTNAKIITHSHGTTFDASSGKFLFALNKFFAKLNYKKVVDNTDLFFCCSIAAGVALFGEKYRDKLILVRNGIDVDLFSFNEKSRKDIRSELQVSEETTIVALIGRLAEQKNPVRAIEIFNAYHKINQNSILLCVGTGDLKDLVVKKGRELGVIDSMLFLGFRNDVCKLLSAIDVQIMPSFFEGLPLGGIEAQVAGVPIVFSDGITKEVAVTDICDFLSLEEDNACWAKAILKLQQIPIERQMYKQKIIDAGYSKQSTLQFVENLLS